MTREVLQTGSTLDGFKIGEKIHSGGMATLWRVTRPGIDVPIVMKVPTILDGEDATVIVGFEMEMMILPRLSGVHVPKFYAVGDFARQPYIVMEYIKGQSVYALIDRAPLPAEEIVALGAKVSTALVDLHRQNVLHLDIKPSNVMLRESGEAALIDFGLSRHLLLPDLLEEEFRVPMGTGPYIAPEQIMKNRSDPRSDIYSLGVLLYYLATNVRPFGVPQAQSSLKTRLWRDPVPPRRINPAIPPALQEVILRCLEVDPDLRYATPAQLAFDLANLSQVALTDRAHRMDRNSLFDAGKRWFASLGAEGGPQQPRTAQSNLAPIIMVAVDLSEDMEPLSDELRTNVKRVLATMPGVRIACVNVLKLNRLTINYALDESGRNIHVQRLVELKEWGRPLGLSQERITFHVIEHMDPAVALIDYAKLNHVDQVLIGARTTSTLRRLLGSTASQVVAEAPCTVTVVRAPLNSGTVEMAADSEAARADSP
jgi:serine/threonine protein kinase